MRALRRVVHLAAVAVQLLTRIPARPRRVDDDDLRAATVFFPAVGVVVATVAIAARAATEPILGRATATVVAVGAAIAVTGAFHEDGLADSADGLWGGWTPEQRVEIMRDSRLGTYGTLAIVLSVGLRVSLLTPLTLAAFAAAEMASQILGRSAGVAMAAVLPPVSDHGLGAKVVGPAGIVTAAVVGVTSVAAALVGAGRWWWLLLAVCVLSVALVRRIARRRLGGVTGDVLGAANQIAYVAVMATVVGLERAGWR